MNQGKARGDYATAYKLSGATVDKKAQRRLRRSIEQKEFRQEKVNKRRNLCDLSPLNEGDVSRSKNYKDKTPVKARASGKPTKALDRLDQLKKWKEERERKRKTEGDGNKPAFRVSKALDRKSETKLFEPSKMKKHPVKPQPVPVSKPVVTKSILQTSSKPATQRSVKSQPVPAGKTRQTSATRKGKENVSSKQVRIQKEKEHTAKPVTTRILRSSTRPASAESSTRETRQPTNKAIGQPKSKTLPKKSFQAEPTETMSPASNPNFINITQRGDNSENPDSFAPADFTFDVSSFVFRPLSPSSAAGFLSSNQNASCCSFVESNPKRSSTPKRRKQEPFIKIDTTVVEEAAVNHDKTNTDSTTLMEDNETVVTTPVNESKNLRRSSRRRSTLSTANTDNSVQDISKSVEKPKATPKATPRRSLRVSILSVQTPSNDMDSNKAPENNQNEQQSGRRRSLVSSSSDSDAKSNSDADVPSPAKRRSTRRSVTSVTLNEDMKDLALSGTKTRETRRSRRSVAPVVEPLPETEESSQDSDEVFEKEDNSNNISDIDHDKENDKPVDSVIDVNLKFDGRVGQESSGERKTPKRARNKSFGGFRLPNADSVVLSGKRSRRKTLMPKSPEEWVEVLSNSPMVEMSRRKHKLGNTSLPALNFDDVDLDETNPEKENTGSNLTENELSTKNGPVLNFNDELDRANCPADEAPKLVTADNEEQTTDSVVALVESTTDIENKENIETNKTDTEHDVPYFRELLRTETSRLAVMCDHWTDINEKTQLNDDVHGQIRATVGKAQLLISQRFKQFTGLVDDCEFKTGEKETTCTDLDGFWEMVYFQVEDCENKFAELKKLQDNNWVDNTVKAVVKKVKKKTKPAVTKPAVKSKFAAFRAQMQKQKTDSVNSPAAVQKVEEKVFEIPGFFTVSSPVRTPKPHCAAGTPNKATPSTSTKKEESAKKQVLKDSLALPNGSAELVVGTPPRRSYLPAVPSPLLQDTTPLPRPARGCTRKTPIPKRIIDEVEGSELSTQENENKKMKRTSARRSLRSRQSVNFADPVPDSPKPDETDVDFARLLQPSTSMTTDDDVCDVSNESFSKYLEPSSVLDASVDKVDTPVRSSRRRSCLKGCKATERRRSRQRSVHFGSPKSVTGSNLILPHTPYNKDSLVVQKRVTRSTPSKSYDIFDFENDDNDENVPPPSYRSPRVSLLGTPPDMRRKVVPTVEVPTATLICFTP